MHVLYFNRTDLFNDSALGDCNLPVYSTQTGDLHDEKPLGSGHFSTVKRYRCRPLNDIAVAVKIFNSGKLLHAYLLSEIWKVWKSLTTFTVVINGTLLNRSILFQMKCLMNRV